MSEECSKIIEKLQLIPYPGIARKSLYFKEVYRSKLTVKPLDDSRENRNVFTSIYMLGMSGDCGVWRRLANDETFFYHRGDTLRIAIIKDQDTVDVINIGDSLTEESAVYQFTVAANQWFNHQVSRGVHGYSLLGVVVAPGYDPADISYSKPDTLTNEFPHHKKIIEQFTSK